jgi:hypothetical protein
MATRNRPPGRADEEDVEDADVALTHIKDLMDAEAQRQHLVLGTAEYSAALDTEERLAAELWRRVQATGLPTARRQG